MVRTYFFSRSFLWILLWRGRHMPVPEAVPRTVRAHQSPPPPLTSTPRARSSLCPRRTATVLPATAETWGSLSWTTTYGEHSTVKGQKWLLIGMEGMYFYGVLIIFWKLRSSHTRDERNIARQSAATTKDSIEICCWDFRFCFKSI